MADKPAPGDVVVPTVTASDTQEVNSSTVQAAAGQAVSVLTPVAEAVATDAAQTVLDEFKKTKLGKETVSFFDSAVGKSVQTLLWTLGAFLITVVGAKLANIHLDAKLVALGVPGFLNWLLYTVKVFVDGKVPNLPKA